jgi:hypothetical protein
MGLNAMRCCCQNLMCALSFCYVFEKK